MPVSKKRKKTNRTPAKRALQGQLAVKQNQAIAVPGQQRGPQKSIMIGYIHPGEVRGEFATSLFVAGKANHEVVGVLARQSGPRVAAARNVIVKEFMLTSAEWLLFIDSDMFWSQEDLRKVIDAAHPTKRPVVGGLCFADQAGNLFPTLYMRNPENGQFHVALEFPRNQLVPVDGTGAAFIMIHRSVLVKLEQEIEGDMPWFQDTVFQGRDRGEDLTFCQRVRDLGIPIYVHTGADVNHVKQRYLNLAEFERAREAGRFLITGTGRCGTGYITNLLGKLQLATGHEAVYNPQRMEQFAPDLPMWDAFRGEASWLAAPFIQQIGVPTVQLVRNPLETVRSLVGIEMFKGDNPGHESYLAFAEKTLGVDLRSLPAVEAASKFVVLWSGLIEAQNVPRFRVEDMQDPEVLQQLCMILLGGVSPDKSKIKEAAAATATNTNTRKRDESITWDDVTPELRALATEWGYATT